MGKCFYYNVDNLIYYNRSYYDNLGRVYEEIQENKMYEKG